MPYELLKTGMIGGPSIAFYRYQELRNSQVHTKATFCLILHNTTQHNTTKQHIIINTKSQECTSIVGFNANSLYLYCSKQEMPCGKEDYVKMRISNSEELCEELCYQVMKGELFGFLQVDIHIPVELKERFHESCPLFIMDAVLMLANKLNLNIVSSGFLKTFSMSPSLFLAHSYSDSQA